MHAVSLATKPLSPTHRRYVASTTIVRSVAAYPDEILRSNRYEMFLSAFIGLATVVVVFSALGWYQRHRHNNSRRWVWDTRYVDAAGAFVLITGGVLVHVRDPWVRLPALGLLVMSGVIFVVVGFRPTGPSSPRKGTGSVRTRHTLAGRSAVHKDRTIRHLPCGSVMNHNIRCQFCGYELVFSEGSRVGGVQMHGYHQVCPHCYGRCPICGDWYERDSTCPEHPDATLVQCPTI